MQKYIWKNGDIINHELAQTHVLTHGLHYGSAVFEGIRFYKASSGPAVFKLREHIERFFYSARQIGMELRYTVEQICLAVVETIEKNQYDEGYIRPLAYYGEGDMRVVPQASTPIDIIVAVWPWGSYLSANPIEVKTSEFIRIHPKSTIADAKISGHYVNSLLAGLAVQDTKYHEALLLDSDGYVAEAGSANVFIVKNGQIITPELGAILAGITRNTIIELAGALNIPVMQQKITKEDIYSSEEAFFTGTAVEVTPISSLDDKLIKNGKIGKITQTIKAEYEKIVRGQNDIFSNALTYIKKNSQITQKPMSHVSSKKTIIKILDTTLRDGQQSPGAGMSFQDNIKYAHLASDLGIDILEAGFPAASDNDYNIVHAISRTMAQCQSDMTIAALCQLKKEQVIKTMQALRPSLAIGKARIHTYIPVDPDLMQASLGKDSKDYKTILNDIYLLIKLAVNNGYEVQFSLEGYSKIGDNFDFATDAITVAVSAGATIINCPDTIGGSARWQGENYFVQNMKKHAQIIKNKFPNKEITWSAHCHNDLGLALDNSLTAIYDGPARQVEGCINGVGERAGNVALEQVIMNIKQFGDKINKAITFSTNINLGNLMPISNFIANKMLARQPHWPITGDNAAKHTSGGHTNAILKNPMAYQAFDPKIVGDEISFVFGPLSGSNHVKDILNKNGYSCTNDEKTKITQSIKSMYANRRKGITDKELIAGYHRYIANKKQINEASYE